MPLQQAGHPKGSGWKEHPLPEHHPLPGAGELPFRARGVCHSQARTSSAGQHRDVQDSAVLGCSHPLLRVSAPTGEEEEEEVGRWGVGCMSRGARATQLVLCRALTKGGVSESIPYTPSGRASLSPSPSSPSSSFPFPFPSSPSSPSPSPSPSPFSSPSSFPSPSPSLPHIRARSQAHQEHPRLAKC